MPYIEIIREDQAEGELQVVYDEIIAKRGALSEVLMIHSLNPESLRRHMDLYITSMFGKSPLRRPQRE
ncbi:MAG: peroxidase, partial [Bacteroidota bacterium]